MEKIRQHTTTTTITIHDFYCDDCGIHFGTAIELNDGNYNRLGDVEMRIYTPKGWYKINKCFCDKCRTKFSSDVYATLESMGFSIDENKSSCIEVVRCKDCDVPHNRWTGCPNLNGLVPPSDFYCAFGIPKTKDK